MKNILLKFQNRGVKTINTFCFLQNKSQVKKCVIGGLFLFYFILAFLSLYYLDPPVQGFLFGADTRRVFHDWNTFEANHYRTKVHPLYVLFIYPIFSVLKLLGADPYFACVVFCAVVSTANVFLFYKIINKLTKRKDSLVVLITTLLFAVSFAVLDNTIKTESFAVGCLTLQLFWCWFVYNHDKTLKTKDIFVLVLLGVATFSMTTTNYVHFLIGISYIFLFRKFERVVDWFGSIIKMFAVVLLSIFVSLVLTTIQRLIFESCIDAIGNLFDIFLNLINDTPANNEEFKYITGGFSIDRIKDVLVYYFGVSFAGGVVSQAGEVLYINASIFSRIIFLLVFSLFVGGLVVIIKKRKGIYLPFVLALLFELGLHYFYGVYSIILYQMHAIFAVLIVIFAFLDEEIGRKKNNRLLFFVVPLLCFIAVSSIVSIVQTLMKVYENYGVAGYDVWWNAGFILFASLAVIISKTAYWISSNFYKKRRFGVCQNKKAR